MARQGLNSTLSYTRDGATRAFRLRCSGITYGIKQVSEQSQARTYRSVYPHRVSQTTFALQFDLKGHDEYRTFFNWLGSWAQYALTQAVEERAAFPSMSAVVPVRNFSRVGIPIGPFEWGDHVGSMLWRPKITFETAAEPGDESFRSARVDSQFSEVFDPASRFFYPTGEQLYGGQTPPPGTYVQPLTGVQAQSLTDGQAGVDSLPKSGN